MLTIENNDTGRNVYSVKSVNGEFMSSILHILPLIYSIFLPVWIQIHRGPEYGSNLDPDLHH